jgi:hypothetical protein
LFLRFSGSRTGRKYVDNDRVAKVYRVLGGIELFEGRASERRKEVALAASSGCEGELEAGRQVRVRARRSESADLENELGEFGAFFPRSGEISQKSWGKQNGRGTVERQGVSPALC